MQPSVNRLVHYVSYGTPGGEYTRQCRAAIVTAVAPAEPDGVHVTEDGFVVALCVVNPEGLFFKQHVPYDAALEGALPQGGTWHWPELTPQTPAPVRPLGLGDRVLYVVSAADASTINKRRMDFEAYRQVHRIGSTVSGQPGATGHVGHVGNYVLEGNLYPADIVSGGPTSFNLQVQLDGNDTYWATSRAEGEEPGTWVRKP